ncbi:MAG TPA: hypothetical protein VH593_19750 [Ktedonobacteraceae bacterium]|jgi:hypothetical protein
MNQTRPFDIFQTGWYSFRLPGYRPCRGTYERYPYNPLPPIPEEQFTGELQWLTPLNKKANEAMQPYRPTPEQREEWMPQWTDDLKSVIASAQHLGLNLPDAFIRLMSSPALQDRIPSCTACYFDLSQLAFCPGDKEEGYVLRFLHDQQDCVIWHLYLSTHGDECVLASGTYLDQVYTNQDEFGVTEEEAVKYTWVCAPSFEAFLYRFWIENVIWYNLYEHKPLTEEQKRYLSFYGEEKQDIPKTME